MAKLAFIGLGVMGFPMAGHLKQHGHQVCVYNRGAAKAQAWVQRFGGERAISPKLAAANADFVCVCVGNDDDVRSVLYGDEGALAGMKADAVLIDHTTASAELARELYAACKARGLEFLDAPVSGGQKGAESGALSIMVGGDEPVFQQAQSVFECYGRASSLIGPAGSGQLCKMVNQICIAGLLQGLAEALHFAGRANLDIEKVVSVISKGAAQSWQMENRYRTMMQGDYDHGFAVDWMRKDLGIVLDAAREQGASLPVTALVDQFYGDVQSMGGGRWDTSSLLARLEAATKR